MVWNWHQNLLHEKKLENCTSAKIYPNLQTRLFSHLSQKYCLGFQSTFTRHRFHTDFIPVTIITTFNLLEWHYGAHMEVWGQLVKVVSFHHVGPRDQTQLRFAKSFYLLCQLISPQSWETYKQPSYSLTNLCIFYHKPSTFYYIILPLGPLTNMPLLFEKVLG